MHLSGSSYRPALLPVDCPLVSGGLSRGSGSQEGAACLLESPLPHLPRTRRPSNILAWVGGDVPELSAAGRRALRQVEPLSALPAGSRGVHRPPFTAVGVLHERSPPAPRCPGLDYSRSVVVIIKLFFLCYKHVTLLSVFFFLHVCTFIISFEVFF